MTRALTPLVLLLSACTAGKSPEEEDDLLDLLWALDEVEWVSELEPTVEGTRYFALGFQQPVDHADPGGATFTQVVGLLHRDLKAPVAYETLGYGNGFSGRDDELSSLLGGNRIDVEHRYFVNSLPDSPDWDQLRVEQSAADHHAIAASLQRLYTGAWLSTGASKGGVTALLYRYFYPDDVAGTVAYVAPFVDGYPDERYDAFFDDVGSSECRDRLTSMQRTLLSNRETLAPRVEGWGEENGFAYARVGADYALQVSTSELSWTFWQYDGDCDALPADPDDVEAVFAWFLDSDSSPYWYSDPVLDYFGPYFFQCAAELGYPALKLEDIQDLLTVDPADVEPLLPDGAALPDYDPTQVEAAADWLATNGNSLMLIYGDEDPWTVGELVLDGATDSYSYLASGSNHGADISSLSSAEQTEAAATLRRWVGQ